MQISVIGAGYVGLTTAACLSEIGHQVLCADNDLAKLEVLRAGRLPFFEPHLDELVERNREAGRLTFVTTEEAIDRGQVLFICVGTPPLENGEADLAAIEAVARQIAQRGRGYRLVIEKSTVPVQTAQRLCRHLAIYNSNRLDYDVVSNPEFLREGSAVEDFFHPDRIVVGADSARAVSLMKEIYEPVLNQPASCPAHASCPIGVKPAFLMTDTSSAEIVKHASNSFLAMKISFINMIADLCEVAGADIENVAEGIGMDRRIGSAFLRPGIGFGGFCFPKDLQAFVHIGEKLGCNFSLLREVEKINMARVEHFLARVRKELWVLRGKTIAVWGLAFKPNTDDVRFAPSLAIVRRLLAEGANVQAYDPQATEKAKRELPQLTYCADAYSAANHADAILILTEWNEFRRLDWQCLAQMVDRPLVLDGRNMLSAAELTPHGFEYISVGRGAASSDASAAVAVSVAGQSR
jgi:UDPglucose 6-dehydrogenase